MIVRIICCFIGEAPSLDKPEAGMGANELRAAGFSLAELRLAGFSHAILSQTNKVLRSYICRGNLSILPQLNPKFDPKRVKLTPDPFVKLWSGACAQVPTQMTPRIREHTDYVPKPKSSRPQSCQVENASMELQSLGRPMTVG